MKPCFFSLILASALWSQTIEGDLVNALTGAPVSGARIRCSRYDTVVISDAGGHFSFPVSGEGAALQIARPGYLQPLLYQVPNGVHSLRIRLMPQAVIAGKILDEDGFPVGNAQIAAMRYRMLNGRRFLQTAASDQSDDQGLFRISGLPAGRYYLRVTPHGNTPKWDGRYVPRFYRDAFRPADIDRIDVKAGEERVVNFALSRFEGVTVKGRLQTSGPSVSQATQVFLRAEGDLPFTWNTLTFSNGDFVFLHVPPGAYKICANGHLLQPPADWRSPEQRLDVGRSDVTGVVFALRPREPVDLAGSIAFEGSAVP
jgi:hypothetical protein